MRSLGAAVLFLFAVAGAAGTPLPIAPHEKAASEYVVAYLARGAPGIYGALASTSPFREAERSDAMQEIMARLGPPEGASWSLRVARPGGKYPRAVFAVVWPSQIDDVITFEMIQENGVWKILTIRTLAEPAAFKPWKAPESPGPDEPADRRTWPLFLAGIVAPLLSAIGALARRHRPRAGTALLVLSLAVFAAQMALLVWDPAAPKAADAKKTPRKYVEMGRLSLIRQELATGESPSPLPATPPETVQVGKLWLAQSQMLTEAPAKVARQIDSLSFAGQSPLADLLRARMAVDRGDGRAALALYTKAGGTAHDAFWLEEVSIATTPEDARKALAEWATHGCRDAELHYILSGLAAASSVDGAREEFLNGWRVQPLPREDVVAAGIFAGILGDPAIAGIVNLKSPREWQGSDLQLSRDPMDVPPGVTAVASGTYLEIEAGGGALAIPAGSRIAPKGTTVLGASAWKHREEEAALADLEERGSLRARGSTAAQARIELAVGALAAKNAWDRVTELTDWIDPDGEAVSAQLLIARLEALVRARRLEEARGLVQGGVIGRSARFGAGGMLLVSMGDRLLGAGDFDTALDLYKRAALTTNPPDVAARIRQVEVRRKLASSPWTRDTQHFRLRATPDVPDAAIAFVGNYLERELGRITTRLGLPDFEPTQVSIVEWSEFATDLTGGMDVLGFYDSEIVVPFANVPGYADAIERVLAHELTHAVIAQATDDMAPRWYHEGVATRLETESAGGSVFTARSGDEVFSISVLDAMLASSPDPGATAEAYATAQTFVRFLEETYGGGVLVRLNDAFRSGNTTEVALADITGTPLVELDQAFRLWGKATARSFTRRSVDEVDDQVRKGIRFSREKKP